MIERAALERADLLLAPTRGILDATVACLGEGMAPAELFPVLFDPESFPERGRDREPGPLRALFYGRLEACKNPDLALHALAAARAMGLECTLTVVGSDVDGYRARVLEPLEAELGLDAVSYEPHIEDLYVLRRVLAETDVAILPSSSGMAILESLSSGVNVITSDRVELPGVPEKGLASLPIEDPVDFGRQAAALIADPDWMAGGSRAAAWVRERFSADAEIERLLDCYAKALAAGPRSAREGSPATVVPDAIEGARQTAVLAFVEELITEPSLLEAWARTFDASDDITLVILTPAWSPDVVERKLGPVVEQAGLHSDDAADLLAVAPPASAEAHARLAAGATAVLSRRRLVGPFDALRRVDERSIAALREGLALAQAA